MFRTVIADLETHESGYVALEGHGVEISALPLLDRTHGTLARLGHGDRVPDVRLPSTGELDALNRVSLHVEPCTLPNKALCSKSYAGSSGCPMRVG